VWKYRWALKYGPIFLAAMAGVNGALFTSHFRQRMMLRFQARLSSYIPGVIVPFYSSLLLQQNVAYAQLLGLKIDCIPCANISAVSFQV